MTSPYRPPAAPDLAVIGAGPMGLVAALTAARAGLRVAVHERAGDFSAAAGWMAGGMLAPECEADGSSPAVVDLGRRGLELWPTLVPEVRLDGTLVVAAPRDAGQLSAFAARTANHQMLGAGPLATLEPALAGRFGRGLFYAGEGHLDPRRSFALLAAALEAAGVPIHFNAAADPDTVPGARVLDCRGLGARDREPELRGVKGEMALLRTREVALARPVRLLHHRHPLYVVPRADGVFMIGATTIESDGGPIVSLRSAGELLTQAYALHPAFAEAEVLAFHAGLRPAFPDNEPRLTERGRVIAVNGLYRHGWLIAPALAEDAVQRLLVATETAR